MRPDRNTPSRPSGSSDSRRHRTRAFRPALPVSAAGATLLCGVLLAAALPGVASAATAVQLNTVAPFAILAGTTVRAAAFLGTQPRVGEAQIILLWKQSLNAGSACPKWER